MNTLAIMVGLAGTIVMPLGSAMAENLQPVASAIYQPQKGSAERRAIMDAARVPVSRELGQTVIFVADTLRTDGRMAYLQATPLNPDGTPFNWLASPFAEDWRGGFMSDIIMVLLENKNGRWTVVEHIIGPTDVAWYDWVERFSLPENLFYAF